MEPPTPFGKTHAVVCAANRNEAKEMVPASSGYPITAALTTLPVTWPYRCYCEVKSPTQLDHEIDEVLSKP